MSGPDVAESPQLRDALLVKSAMAVALADAVVDGSPYREALEVQYARARATVAAALDEAVTR